jgi:DNA polymerase elongation subunit (family B)
MLYETNINKCKRKSMGIVLKRRDNAPVVKDIYGGIIDIIMKEQDIEKAVKFTKKFLQDIVDEKIPLDKLIITKSLREFYKNPESIAHKVLADRIGKRDPGNKPSTGSRIPFVYIQTGKNVKLQGDKVEHPNFIKENKLKPDYGFYITNQIMKPVSQIYALVLEDLKDFKKKLKGFERKKKSLERKWSDNDKKCREYVMKERNKHVKELIFDNSLRNYNNIKNGQRTLISMFG